jgi:hypothetical protein
MADSKIEQVMQAILNQLALISPVNGYTNTLESIQRFDMTGNSFVKVPVVILQLSEITQTARVQPNIVWERATVLVGVYVRHDKELDTRSTDAILISLDSDIYAATMFDRTLGGLTKDLSRVSVFPEDIEEPIKHVGHVSEFMVEYTHQIDSVVT